MLLAPAGSEWERLLRHLDLVEGFRLYILISPSVAHAEAARAALATSLEAEGRDMETLVIPDEPSLRNLANLLIAPPVESEAEILWVGLYPPTDVTNAKPWEEALRAGLAGLNQTRNFFAQRQERPVILAGTASLSNLLPSAAPDLWSIRSTVIRLPVESQAKQQGFITPKEDRFVVPPSASLSDAERALAAAEQARHRPGAELDRLRYLIRAAKALEGRGYHEKLGAILDEALALANSLSDSEGYTELPTLINNLAQCFQSAARYAEAEPLMRRALAVDEKVFGSDHHEIAIDLNNLAQLLQATNRLAEAEPLMRRALAIDEKALGSDHPNIAIRLNNLAGLLQATNRLAEAEPLMRRALAIDEKAFGSDHPRAAIRLNNLAQLLQATNRLAEAEPLMRHALAIDEKVFGSDHPDVAIDLNNLAQLLQDTNRLAEAEPLMRRALAIDEKALGSDHPDVATRLNNLAALLQATNRLAEAEPLLRRALAIDEKAFGNDHPKVAIDLNNLAHLLLATNRLAEAEPFTRRALTIDEKAFGRDHPHVAIRLNNLAQLFRATNRLTEAEPLMRRALEIFLLVKARTGFDFPNLYVAVKNYSTILKELGWSEEQIAAHLEELTTTAQKSASSGE